MAIKIVKARRRNECEITVLPMWSDDIVEYQKVNDDEASTKTKVMKLV